MQWTDGENAGFTKGTPWIGIPENYHKINAVSEENDPGSVLNFYRKLVSLRKEYSVISEGSIKFQETGNEKVFAFTRTLGEEELAVLCSFSGEEEKTAFKVPAGEILIGNYPEEQGERDTLRPFEVVAVYNKE